MCHEDRDQKTLVVEFLGVILILGALVRFVCDCLVGGINSNGELGSVEENVEANTARQCSLDVPVHTASFWNIIIQWTSYDDLTEK